MFPAYGYKNGYPHGRPQMSAGHPTSEGFPPEMKMESSSSPFMYEPWPQQFGYPIPSQYHSCCNHNPHPGYYAYRPPYPHFPSPQCHPQYHGSYSLYPEPYPFPYPLPQQFPGFNCDMSMPREFHCCGCPHNKSHTEGDNVRIEEQEPEADKEDSVVPTGFKNLHHPIVWIPPDYLKDEGSPRGTKASKNLLSGSRDPKKWNGWLPLDFESIKQLLQDGDDKRSQDHKNKIWIKPREREAEEHKEGLTVMGPQQVSRSAGKDPSMGNGWMPLDLESIKRMLQSGELKRDQGSQPSNQSQQSPSPIIWLPYDNEGKSQMRNQREASAASEASVPHLSNFNHIPLTVQHGDDQTQKTIPAVEAEGNKGGNKSMERSNHLVKTIPVKQMEEHAVREKESDAQARCKHEKSIEHNKISTDNGTKSKSLSPKKASKLPPVCLRLDPLPKKKNGKGNSRSPSPPGHEDQQADGVKSSSSSTTESKVPLDTEGPKKEAEKQSMELPHEKKSIKVVDMSDGSTNIKVGKTSKLAADEADKVDLNVRKDASANEAVENHGEVIDDGGKTKSKEVEMGPDVLKPAHKILSGSEAAIIIQSAYRGYEVRRWEPLKKLRKIADVREEAAEVRKCIESAPSSLDPKQKVALGETIMELLLKLDTIQGLHPSVRDVRKSVAKELVSLQERLDNLVIKQPEQSLEDSGVIESTVQFPEKSSETSGLSGAEYQQGGKIREDQKDNLPNLKELPGEGPFAVSHLSCTEEVPEQTCPDKESPEKSSESKVEDQEGGKTREDQKDNLSNLEELTGEEPLTVSHLSCSEEEIPEQACPDKESQVGSHETGGAVEAGGSLSDSLIQQNRFDKKEEGAIQNPTETPEAHGQCPESKHENAEQLLVRDAVGISTEESLTPVEYESSPMVNFDSVDQTDEKNDLLGELPLALSGDVIQQTTDVAPEKGQQANMMFGAGQLINEEPDAPVIEPEKHESDEASEGGRTEAPIAKHEKNESDDVSKGEDLGEQDAECKVVEDLGEQDAECKVLDDVTAPTSSRESDVNLIEPVTLEPMLESSPVEQAQELSPEISCVKLENNANAEFEEGGELPLLVDAQAEEPIGNPINNETGDNTTKGNECKNEISQDDTANLGDGKMLEQENNCQLVDSKLHVEGANLSEEQVRLSLGSTENMAEDERERKIIEENEKMRNLLEKLIASGKQQQEVISNLNGKLKDLESKLAKQRKKKKTATAKRARVLMPRSCKTSKGLSKEAPMGLAS